MVTKTQLTNLMRSMFRTLPFNYGERVHIKSYNKNGTVIGIEQLSEETMIYKINIDTNDKATWNGEFHAEDLILL